MNFIFIISLLFVFAYCHPALKDAKETDEKLKIKEILDRKREKAAQELLKSNVNKRNAFDIQELVDQIKGKIDINGLKKNIFSENTQSSNNEINVNRNIQEFEERLKSVDGKIKSKLNAIFNKSRVVRASEPIENNNSGEFYQGDILLSLEQTQDLAEDDKDENRERRSAYTGNHEFKWPLYQPISYSISNQYTQALADNIRKGFKFWSDNTCLNFQENGSTTPRIIVNSGNGCYSYVGRQYQSISQELSLGSGCELEGTIVHEIAHALGLQHTQSRWDRDSYINIHADNIDSRYLGNFDRMNQATNNNFGVDYDYGSVMHYDQFAFALSSSKRTITAKDEYSQITMGQRERAAFSDVKILNSLYECHKRCPSTLPCQNGGIIDSKNCNSCICPYMFSGQICADRHPGRGYNASQSICGNSLEASPSWQSINGLIGVAWSIYKDNLTECFWNIDAPYGKKIEVRLNNADVYCSPECYWQGIELFMRGSTMGGYKFCCMGEVAGKIIQSTESSISIRLYARYHTAPLNVDYRFI